VGGNVPEYFICATSNGWAQSSEKDALAYNLVTLNNDGLTTFLNSSPEEVESPKKPKSLLKWDEESTPDLSKALALSGASFLWVFSFINFSGAR
jgi:hypothetical protein